MCLFLMGEGREEVFSQPKEQSDKGDSGGNDYEQLSVERGRGQRRGCEGGIGRERMGLNEGQDLEEESWRSKPRPDEGGGCRCFCEHLEGSQGH